MWQVGKKSYIYINRCERIVKNLSCKNARAELTSRFNWVRYVCTSSTNDAAGIPLLSVALADVDISAADRCSSIQWRCDCEFSTVCVCGVFCFSVCWWCGLRRVGGGLRKMLHDFILWYCRIFAAATSLFGPKYVNGLYFGGLRTESSWPNEFNSFAWFCLWDLGGGIMEWWVLGRAKNKSNYLIYLIRIKQFKTCLNSFY